MKVIVMIGLLVVMLMQSGCASLGISKSDAKKYAVSLISPPGGDPLAGYQKEYTYTDSNGATVVPPIKRYEVLRRETTVELEKTNQAATPVGDDAASNLP